MATYDSGPTISRPPAEAITVASTEPLPTRARLFVKLTDADRVAKALNTDEVDGVAEYAVDYTGDDFADSAVGVIVDGFPFVRILNDVLAGDRLRPADDGSGYADVCIGGQKAVAIAKTGATAASDSPFVRCQLLRRAQRAALAQLTETGAGGDGGIGGANDGVFPDLTLTSIAVVDNTTGEADTVSPATLLGVTNPNLGAWDGAHDPTGAEAVAINAAITSLKNSVATIALVVDQIRTDLAAVRDAVREVATGVNVVAE